METSSLCRWRFVELGVLGLAFFLFVGSLVRSASADAGSWSAIVLMAVPFGMIAAFRAFDPNGTFVGLVSGVICSGLVCLGALVAGLCWAVMEPDDGLVAHVYFSGGILLYPVIYAGVYRAAAAWARKRAKPER